MTLRIPPPAFMQRAGLRAVLAALPGSRPVGGCVRDAIAGYPVSDIDLATPLPPDAVLAALDAAGLRGLPTGIAHGTITALAAGETIEVTTLRRDVATDGRHATVAFTDDWQLDAARRDFTFNALSLTAGCMVHDYFGGVADLQAGRVVFVGDPAARLAEDRLRALRYFRFFARFATADPDETVAAALRASAPVLHTLSAERIWGECKRILAAPDPRAALAWMWRLDVLAAILPEAAARGTGLATGLDQLDRLVAAGAPADPLLRLAAVVGPGTARVAERLRLSTVEATRLAALQGPVPDGTDAGLRRALADTPAEVLIGRVWLAGGDAELRARLATMPRPVFPLEGRDVLATGVPPGPRVGRLLRAVRDWWMRGGCMADKTACRAQITAYVRLDPVAPDQADGPPTPIL